ncbi:MAG: hypothetical protein RBS80_18370 [Thermoguttaceae bacterium]|jgi:hypothetical protein|nr:hypothetical protein [Thermoguttaceae bacterium]
MRIWYAALIVLCCTLAVGCRTNQHIAALQRDNRLKEDEIYRLRWLVEDYEEELDRRRESQGSDTEPGLAARTGQSILDRLGAPADSTATAQPTQSELPVQVGESMSPNEFLKSRDVVRPADGPTLTVPDMDDDVPAPAWPAPAPVEPPGAPEAADEAPRWSPPPARHEKPKPQQATSAYTPPSGNEGAAPRAAKEGRLATQLRIDAHATGGHDLDGRAGDDGLRVVIQPLDENQRLVIAPAEVSIVLLDPNPALKGDAARVARWDFTADEVASAIRASDDGVEGILLKVVWRDNIPQNEHLHLFVRYTAADGRQLEDQLELQIRLPGTSPSPGWKTVPQESPPPPPQEDRATTQPDPPHDRTRLASRSVPAPSPQPETPSQPRLKRPQWSPNRP